MATQRAARPSKQHPPGAGRPRQAAAEVDHRPSWFLARAIGDLVRQPERVAGRPPAQAAIAEVQRLAGNRAAQRLLARAPARIQRQPRRRAKKEVALGTVAIAEAGSTSQPASVSVTAKRELVPEGEKASGFKGFADKLDAYAEAWRQADVSVVAEDKQGRFHTFLTDLGPPSRRQKYALTPSKDSTFVNLSLVAVFAEDADADAPSKEAQATQQRVKQAKLWWQAWRRKETPADFLKQHPKADLRAFLEQEFAAILVESLSIDAKLIHVASGEPDWKPGLLNLDLTLESEGKGGIASLPLTGAVSPPVVVVGPWAFESASHLHALSTVIHELTHYRHAKRSIALRERYLKTRTKKHLVTWLRQQKKVSAVDKALLEEKLDPGGVADRPNTQMLAHLEAFVGTYHRLPITKDVKNALRFEELDKAGAYWHQFADPEVKKSLLQRLADYYQSLDGPRQRDFKAHVEARLKAAQGDKRYAALWKAVAEKVVGI